VGKAGQGERQTLAVVVVGLPVVTQTQSRNYLPSRHRKRGRQIPITAR
jgi:hypothetical protein